MSAITLQQTQGSNQPDIEKRKLSCHRHCTPEYNKHYVNTPIIKRLGAIINKFDWHKCKPIMDLRRSGGSILMKVSSQGAKRFKTLMPRRLKIRAEREETLTCLIKAIVNNVEYSPDARYIYECMLSIEELAKEIGQLHEYKAGYDDNGKYRHGRKAYDPVLGALEDLEASKMILVVREFDKETKQYKASRLFLTPTFFQSLGLTAKETKKMIAARNRYNAKNKVKYRRVRPLSDKMANIDNKALESLFFYHRKWFNGELEADTIEEKAKRQLEKIATPKERTPLDIAKQDYFKFTQQMPSIMVTIAESEVKKAHPNLAPLEFYPLVIARLKH